MLPEDWQAHMLEMVNCNGQRAEIKRARARLPEELRRLKRPYWEMAINDATHRRERTDAQAALGALVLPEETDMPAAGQFLEALGMMWGEVAEAERKELLGLLRKAVTVDVGRGRLACIQPQAPYVALFRQLRGLQEKRGCFSLAVGAGM